METSTLNKNRGFYKVGFLPINPRLIEISMKFSRLLNVTGVSSTVLKTSINGDDHNGWSTFNVSEYSDITITKIDEMYFEESSNFFSYTYRIIKSRKALEEKYVPNFDVLIIFMDDYAEAEVLIPIVHAMDIPIVLFQEGFFVTENKNNFNFYYLLKYIRRKLLPHFFTNNLYGENSDIFLIWSEYGFFDYLTDLGVSEEKIHVVGNPFSSNKRRKKIQETYTRIQVNHSPLFPRFSSKKWEKNFWLNLVSSISRENYSISLKPHPRIGYEDLLELFPNHDSTDSRITVLDRTKASESFYDDHDVLVNIFSASSFEALYRGMPVIFIKSQYNNVKILEELANKGEIILVDHIREIPEIIYMLNYDKDYKDKVISSGYEAALKLGGELHVFEKRFTDEIQKIVNNIDGKL